ncbi:E3 ubiquitin-protein ligase ATL42 [Acorus gramineus]|uniref:RING-type E3 ubiquitin transferase n=1 Tax=Acorus gramineus TaxID=55184 RepID=A0AAV9AJF7_ACOGR|nr:E3 ubiquitin-protein ligase ATL42 [Acorus gramineus]
MMTGVNLVMTVIGFGVSTMFIVFVCTRLICARIQLTASRRSFPSASRADHLTILERGMHGLEPVVVAKFPTKKFGDKYFSSEDDTLCTVCLSEYQEKDVLRILPYCGHAFHVTCIDMWLQQHATCPVCRISLRESPERRRLMQPMFSSVVRSSETLEPPTYHYLYTGNNYSTRTEHNSRMESIQEDRFLPDLDSTGPGEATSVMTEVHCRMKNVYQCGSEGKIVESPSNTQEN